MRYVSEEDIQAIIESRHQTPDTVLGPTYLKDEKMLIIRAFIPDAREVSVQRKRTPKTQYKMNRIREEGFFELVLEKISTPFTYKLAVTDNNGNTYAVHDAYAYQQTIFSDFDRHLFSEGKHYRLFEKFGAHGVTNRSIRGVNFCVWAPNAARVSVVGQFDNWDGRRHPMVRLEDTGVWELFVPDIGENEPYLYEIKTQNGNFFTKHDTFAFLVSSQEQRGEPVYEPSNRYKWQDEAWMKESASTHGWKLPFVVYDLDKQGLPGERNTGQFTFDQLSDTWLTNLKNQGFTYISLSPFQGGLIKSFYAPNQELGTPESLMAFVDRCHGQGIEVLLHGISSEFTQAANEMAWYDGAREYEYEDEKKLLQFNLKRHEVKCFVISNFFFWLEKYHFDGVMADLAVSEALFASMKANRNQFKKFRFVNDIPRKTVLTGSEIQAIVGADHGNPHSVLGPHALKEGGTVVRVFYPESEAVYLTEDGLPNILYKMTRLHESGFYEVYLDPEPSGISYRLHALKKDRSIISFPDPYSFTESFVTDFDLYLFGQGNHYEIYEKLGAHVVQWKGVSGVNFVLWAPNARRVSVVGPFNQWDGRYHTMRKLGDMGLWELFIPDLHEGTLYKYEVKAKNTDVFLKTDPYAFFTETPPATAALIYDIDNKHTWKDSVWVHKRGQTNQWESPMSIYEVHLGSWMRGEDNRYLTYSELAQKLIPYIVEMGFTHIELLPITEYPFDPSWGYQVSSYFAPTSRYGRPEGLMGFIDTCHQNNIGVILDWVPAHFPKDAHALAWFDGTCLYEHADPRKGEHKDWGTLIFNYGRHEVENFLIANAMFWLKKYHFDGLRVDAVASMLYLDYSRKEGEWIPNKYGGRENLEAIELIKHTNSVVSKEIPGVMLIAEESTAWPMVSRPTEQGGLGFGLKWNMGWMHDVLLYMSKDPIYRKHHHHNLTFGLVYAFNENFILSLSHDEVVHLKKSLLNKMPGNEWQRFANLRLLYAFMYAHPGKKLLFMGGEIGQQSEWNHDKSIEWFLLENPSHKGIQTFFKDLSRLYAKEKAMHEIDFHESGFEWIDVNNADDNIVSFLRKAKDPRNALIFAMNFSSVSSENYRMGVPFPGIYREILNSDASEYWGDGNTLPDKKITAEELPCHNRPFSITLNLPSLTAVVLKPAPYVDEYETEPELVVPEVLDEEVVEESAAIEEEIVEEEIEAEEPIVIEEEIVEEEIEAEEPMVAEEEGLKLPCVKCRKQRKPFPARFLRTSAHPKTGLYIRRKPGWLKKDS